MNRVSFIKAGLIPIKIFFQHIFLNLEVGERFCIKSTLIPYLIRLKVIVFSISAINSNQIWRFIKTQPICLKSPRWIVFSTCIRFQTTPTAIGLYFFKKHLII